MLDGIKDGVASLRVPESLCKTEKFRINCFMDGFSDSGGDSVLVLAKIGLLKLTILFEPLCARNTLTN